MRCVDDFGVRNSAHGRPIVIASEKARGAGETIGFKTRGLARSKLAADDALLALKNL